MRVIAGTFRHRKLLAPTGLETRPILDRVKVALFDWLGSQLDLPGSLPPIRVLDVFCGGGSLGIEALSRGAAFCAFVETSQEALVCLQSNLKTLGLERMSQVIFHPAESLRPRTATGEDFDLVFLDPPYAYSRDITDSTRMGRLLDRLGRTIPLSPGAIILWRHDARDRIPDSLPGGWIPTPLRTWGAMSVTRLVPQAPVTS